MCLGDTESLPGSSRVWPSSKTSLQCVHDYDSDADDEGLESTGIHMDGYPRSTWCVMFVPDS